MEPESMTKSKTPAPTGVGAGAAGLGVTPAEAEKRSKVNYLGGVLLLGRLELIFELVGGEARTNKAALPRRSREVAVWFGEGDAYGTWKYTLVLAPSGEVYLREEWAPAPGYRWEEVRIYRVVEE